MSAEEVSGQSGWPTVSNAAERSNRIHSTYLTYNKKDTNDFGNSSF